MKALLATTGDIQDVGVASTSNLSMVVTELVATIPRFSNPVLPVVGQSAGVANGQSDECAWDGPRNGFGLRKG